MKVRMQKHPANHLHAERVLNWKTLSALKPSEEHFILGKAGNVEHLLDCLCLHFSPFMKVENAVSDKMQEKILSVETRSSGLLLWHCKL